MFSCCISGTIKQTSWLTATLSLAPKCNDGYRTGKAKYKAEEAKVLTGVKRAWWESGGRRCKGGGFQLTVLWQCNKLAWPLASSTHLFVRITHVEERERESRGSAEQRFAITPSDTWKWTTSLRLLRTRTNPSENDSQCKLWLSTSECPHETVQKTMMVIKHGNMTVACYAILLYSMLDLLNHCSRPADWFYGVSTWSILYAFPFSASYYSVARENLRLVDIWLLWCVFVVPLWNECVQCGQQQESSRWRQVMRLGFFQSYSNCVQTRACPLISQANFYFASMSFHGNESNREKQLECNRIMLK